MHPAHTRFLRLLTFYALALLLLHLWVESLPAAWAFWWYPAKLVGPGGRLHPAEWLWGVYPFTFWPAWLRWISVTLAAGIVLWAGFGAGAGARLRLRLPLPSFPLARVPQALLALLSFPLFWLGRVVHTRWGDAYLLVKGIAHPDVRLTYNWQAPFDTYVHARLFQWGERAWGWTDALPAYWWLSSLAGAAAVWTLLRLAAALGRDDGERWGIFVFMSTLGSMQLFFGYPENYTIISLLILLYLWQGWRYAHGRASLWTPSLILALAHGFHPATLVLQPSLWLLALAAAAPGRRITALRRQLPALILPPLLAAAGVVALMTGYVVTTGPVLTTGYVVGGSDARWLVPLTAPVSSWEYYTLFSRGHLIEMINQQLLAAPFTLPALALLLACCRRSLPRDRTSRFLLVAAGAYLLLIWLWNPDYGGQRDWDLFAPAAWPATLLAAYWLTRALPAPARNRSLLIIVVVQLLHTAAWIYSNTRPWEWGN